MSNLDHRADRVRIIAHTLHGSVLDRDGDKMVIEIPADLLGDALGLLGQGGFGFSIGKQTSPTTTKRIIGMSGQIVVCEGHEELMAFYEINVDLTPKTVRVADLPHAGAIRITAPTKPFGG